MPLVALHCPVQTFSNRSGVIYRVHHASAQAHVVIPPQAAAQHTLRAEAFTTFESFLSKAAALDHDLRCYDDVLGFVAEVRDRARRTTRIAEAFPRGVRDRAWRGLIKGELYDYQREGALFAVRAGRSLIGDEMGLGKTVQAIAAAEIMARECGVERVLVVCPTSLEHQWEREIARPDRRRERGRHRSAGWKHITPFRQPFRHDSICVWSPSPVG